MANAARYDTVSGELFTLTYGALVAQLVKDYEDPVEVSIQLETLGYSIGVRVVDEFCAKVRGAKCGSFRESMDTLARDGLRMFLGVAGVVEGWAPDGSACVLRLPDNPLADWVELPPALAGKLRYSNVLAGAIRGALEMLSMRVEVSFVKDVLNGDDSTEIAVALKEVIAEGANAAYNED